MKIQEKNNNNNEKTIRFDLISFSAMRERKGIKCLPLVPSVWVIQSTVLLAWEAWNSTFYTIYTAVIYDRNGFRPIFFFNSIVFKLGNIKTE